MLRAALVNAKGTRDSQAVNPPEQILYGQDVLGSSC